MVWTQLTVYVPKVSHNTFDVSGYDIGFFFMLVELNYKKRREKKGGKERKREEKEREKERKRREKTRIVIAHFS